MTSRMSAQSSDSELALLQTEARNPRTADLDSLNPEELARALHEENHQVAGAIDEALPQVARAIELIADRLRRGGKLYYIGAGTSGRLGVLDASECPPTFGVDSERVQGIIAGGERALRFSIEGAEDDRAAGSAEIRSRQIDGDDVLVGIAASGRTPYVIGALDAAREAGAATIAVVNSRPAALDEWADITIAAVTGPEAITGSTRMKAGTAQKMILNMLSTCAMVLLGKTYGNLMVDVRATNEKLRDRAIRIVVEAAGVSREKARTALEQCDWHAKTAVVVLSCSLSPEEARVRLEACGGFVLRALEAAG